MKNRIGGLIFINLFFILGCAQTTTNSQNIWTPPDPFGSENIVTNGLALQLEAPSANGYYFPGFGCTYLSWADRSGSGNHGNLYNFTGCNINDGWNGNGTTANPYSLNFDGGISTSYVGLSFSPTTNFSDFTIEAWVKVQGAGQRTIISYGANSANQGIQIYVNAGGFVVGSVIGDAPLVTGSNINDGLWHYVALTQGNSGSPGHFALYVDGNVPVFVAPTTRPNITNAGGNVGTDLLGINPFNGSIAKIAVYNRVLSPREVSQNCNASIGRFASAVGCPPIKNRMFVTSSTYLGSSIGGLVGADTFCSNRAAAAGLGGVWKAWLSTSTVNAISRMPAVNNWYQVNQVTQVFAAFPGNNLVALDHDELNTPWAALVWTGSTSLGVLSTNTCGDWTGGGAGDQGSTSSAGNSIWSQSSPNPCATPAHLYCFEQ